MCFYFYLDIRVENFTYKLYYIFYAISKRLVKYSPYARIYFDMNFIKILIWCLEKKYY